MIEGDTSRVRQLIQTTDSSDSSLRDRLRLSKQQAEKPGAVTDWKRLTRTMIDAHQFGDGDLNAILKLHEELRALDAAGLLAGLDEIERMGLAADMRRRLEASLLNLLAEKDPASMLTRFQDRLRGEVDWQFSHAFRTWLGKDRGAALAWFDARVAAGDFESKSLDGKSPAHEQFESAAISSLLASDPAAVGGRLAAWPESERRQLISQAISSLTPESDSDYAALVRSQLPQDQQSAILSQRASHLSYSEGYGAVDDYLKRIQANSMESAAIARTAAVNRLQHLSNENVIDRKAVDEMRSWAASYSPGAVDTITGEALGSLSSRHQSWQQTVDLVRELHNAQPGDDLLVGFLSGRQAMGNVDQALKLAGQIRDPEKAALVIAKLSAQRVERVVPAELLESP